jgi:FAD/FMN-containing dehydrogenase
VLFSSTDRGRYATDASIYQVMPVGVFVPRNAVDVKTALDICRDLGVPIVPRGGGTSQCGQTTGAALVIDHSKHLRNVWLSTPRQAHRHGEPGMVLDHLNARLKPHGLWYPVDVSTSAQATLGGMAGNNSCGSRSIAYGNMVHNVLAPSAWRQTASCTTSAVRRPGTGAARAIGRWSCATWPMPARRDRAATGRKVLRRVAGYNLDIFHPQSERPYTPTARSTWRTCWWAAKARWPDPERLTLQLARCRAPRCWASSTSRASTGDGQRAAHRDAGPHAARSNWSTAR